MTAAHLTVLLDDGVTTAQRTTAPAATGADRGRQVGVTIAEVFCIVGTLVGVGVIGTRVAESSGGALSADATLLAPLGPAFSIWSVVYAGLPPTRSGSGCPPRAPTRAPAAPGGSLPPPWC